MHWEARRRQQFLDRRANAFATRMEGAACFPVRGSLEDQEPPKRDHDNQEFSFQDVRPQTSMARPQTSHVAEEQGEQDMTSGEEQQHKKTEKETPYHGYPRFMEHSMDHFGRHDQFTRWLHDDFLAPLDTKEQQVTMHRLNTDAKYKQLLKRKFALTQERKARDNGFYMF